jgi:hypothetical protein
MIWNRQAEDFTEFMNAAVEAMELIEETIASHGFLDRPFPILAVQSYDLDGKRVPDRAEFLTMMDGLMPDDQKQVIIIQPHVSENMYQRIRGGNTQAGGSDRELFRLRTLEALLHSARAAVVALGADLHVIGSKV